MISSFESGRFAFTSSSHSSRNAISELFDTSSGKFSLAEKNGCLGARIHHEHVRPELLQAPGKLLPVGVLGDEREKVEIALRIAHHPFEIVDLKQAQITMIILDAFLLKFRALLRRKLVSLALTLGPGRPLLIIF